MLEKLKIIFIKMAGWPEGYTIQMGNTEIKRIQGDIKEMRAIIKQDTVSHKVEKVNFNKKANSKASTDDYVIPLSA